jgi:hypothetical protein
MRFGDMVALVALAAAACDADKGVASFECTAEEGEDLYERRIAPLLTDDRVSTCNQCHLSGIDLSIFVQATPCQTMACMAEQGLVDLDAPQQSTVLAWIDRASPSGGITEDTIQAEHDAVLQWIEHTSACGEDTCPTFDDPCGTAAPENRDACELPEATADARPVDDPGDCSDYALELVFREKVYEWRGRCHSCHFDTHVETFADFDPRPPAWITTIGECNVGSLTTLRTLDNAGYLDAENPLQSLLLTKPLDEDLGGVEHGGGAKFHADDDVAYQDFVYFVQRWAACQSNSP